MAVLGCASASAATYRAVVGSTSGLVQVDTATNAETGFTASGGYLLGVATAPGGAAAYAAGENTMTSGGTVVPFTLGTGNPVAGAVLPFPTTPTSNGIPTSDIAVAPDGHSAYVNDLQNDVVLPLNLTTSPATYGSAVAIPDIPVGIVYAPDSATVYVLDSDGGITKIDVASGVAQPRVQLTAVINGDSIALSPDGSTAYVTAAASGYNTKVYPVSVPGLMVGPPITAGVLSESYNNIAVSPDATEAYVIGSNTANHAAVVAVDLTHGTAGTPLDIGGSPESIAVTPDGATIYATTEVGASGGGATPITAATMTAGTPITTHIGSAASVAITAPPAPVASFTVTSAPPGSATSFDASASTVASGTITDYAWDFGDGSAIVHATGPTITHVYAATGTYTATLTESASDGAVASAARSVVISTGPEPVFSPSPQSLSFGSVRVATTGGAQAVTITNAGNGPLMIALDTLGGSDPGDFRLSSDGCDGQTIAAGATCTVSVALAPTIAGARTATLSFADNASGSPHGVTLSGIGIAPAVGLSGALDFGNTSLGTKSAARTVTLTNTGSAPLLMASDALSGTAASEFAIGADDCAGQTLAPGASCTTTVTFTPTRAGARTAALAYTDNAAGSPHAVALTGTGATVGSVSGHVTDASVQPATPLGGALVSICPRGPSGIELGGSACHTTTTDSSGAYALTNLAPGPAAMEVNPASSRLQSGSALLTVLVGPPAVQDFALQPTRPLPDSVTITSPGGSQAGGNPVLYWDDPFQITLPPVTAAPAHATPNSIVVTIVDVSLSSGATPVLGSSLTYLTLYDGSGNAVGSRAIARESPGAAVGGFDFTFGGLAIASGAGGAGSSSLDSATDLLAQSTGLHRQAHGTLGLTIRSARVSSTARATASRRDAGGHPSAVLAAAGSSDTGPNSVACQDAIDDITTYNRGFGVSGALFNLSAPDPGLDALLAAADAACGPEPPPAPPLPPCPGSYPCDPGDENIFDIPLPVDPSGFVMTSTGIPLERARVVLQRSDTKTGRFSPLPNGSLEMSASNRRNPGSTDLNGHFGWDVFPGYYRVAASRHGCRGTALSPSSPVPPPVTDLRLRLNCPGLHRARTLTRILSAKLRGPDTIVTLIVVRRGRRGARPTGLITLEANGKPRGFAFINPRTGRATTLMFGHLRRGTRVTAGYAGNARFAPSSARAHR